MGSLEGDVIKVTPFSDEVLEMFDESYYSDIIDEIVGEIPPMGGIESTPEFPGGNDSLLIYLKNNIQYPENCKKDSISGVVLIEFIIEKDGSISNVKPIVKVHPDLDAEAVRVIENMPKWKPGRQQGKPVRVYYQIPIRFSLQ